MEELYVLSARLVGMTDTSFVRYLYDKIDWNDHLICIKGSRGVGKTTMMMQRIVLNKWDEHTALYASLDHTWFSSHSLLELAEYHYVHGGKYLFLDEVHRYPNWLQEIKNIADYYPSMYVVFSGSSLLKLDDAVADLSRRCMPYTMNGMSFREFLKYQNHDFEPISLDDILIRHTQLSLAINKNIHVLPYFAEYLRHGYFPFYWSSPNTYYARLQRVISTVIDVDMPQAEPLEFGTLYKAKKLLAILAELVPYTLNLSNLCKDIGVNRNQILRLLDLLDRGQLIRKLYADENSFHSLSKPQKILFDNTNLMYALTSRVDSGTLRESFFCNQLALNHSLIMPQAGDVLVDNRLLFEIGGQKKTYRQINNIENSYIVADDIETGVGNKIPLWLFGFLY